MLRKTIAVNLLLSPKRELDFHKRSKAEFLQFVGSLRIKRKLDVPIEVYPLSNGKYYIADGVHRSKAAELANLEFIDALIYNDSIPVGPKIPLADLIVP